MALTLEAANNVWQKTNIALDSQAANSCIRDQFRALKAYLSQVKSNKDLQFVPILATDVDDASGKVLADVACTVYGVFLKKQATATDVFTYIFDDATDDTGIATDGRIMLATLVTGEQVAAFYPAGLAMAAGAVAKSYTESDGVTDSSSADTPNGFIIIGAA